jgi:hypothetical protein
MNVRSLCAAAWLVGVSAIASACVQTFPLDHRPCGCARGYECCLATNQCVSPDEAAKPSCQGSPGPSSERADGPADGKALDTADATAAADVTAVPDGAPPSDTPVLLPDMALLPPPPDMMTLPVDMAQAPPPPPDMMMLPVDMAVDLAPPPVDMAPLPPDMPIVPRVCTTAARRCMPDGRTPQHCNDDGQWVPQLVCELSCMDGICTACTPGARRCLFNAEPQLCSGAGQWQVQPLCTGGNQCSDGLCLCSENCDQGVVVNSAVGVVDLGAGGEALWYHDGQKLWRMNLSNGQVTEPYAVAATHKPTGKLAADGQGNVFWCRQDATTFTAEVMRNGGQFLALECRELQISGNHLYVNSGGRVARFTLAGSGETELATGAITAFAPGDPYLYFGARGNSVSRLSRNAVAMPGEAQMVWQQSMRGDPIASVAVDAEHAYFAPGKQLLRLPVAEGQAAVAQQEDRNIDHIVLSDSHIYWTTVESGAEGGCGTTEVYRRPKIASGPPGSPHRLIRDEGRCPTALVLHGDSLYLGTSADVSGLAPGRIIKLRL